MKPKDASLISSSLSGQPSLCDNTRKGRTLSDGDIAHYQKIVVALAETIRFMQEIDEVIDQHGGWPGAFQVEGPAEEPSPPASPTEDQ